MQVIEMCILRNFGAQLCVIFLLKWQNLKVNKENLVTQFNALVVSIFISKVQGRNNIKERRKKWENGKNRKMKEGTVK